VGSVTWHIRVSVYLEEKRYLTAAFDRSPVTLGALPHNDVVLNDPFVSGEHAEVLLSRGSLTFRDRSTNGSFIKGRRIREEENLGVEATVSIPPYEIELKFEEDEAVWRTSFRADLSETIPTLAPDEEAEEPPASPPLPLLPPVAPAASPSGPVDSTVLLTSPPEATLRVKETPAGLSMTEFTLASELSRIGRGETAEVRIPVGSVSRFHATIQRRHDGSFVLKDLESSNGTFVNGERIREVCLSDGDEVRLGEVSLVFLAGARAAPPPASPPLPPRETTPVRPRSPSGLAELAITTRSEAGPVPVHVVTLQGRVDSYNYIELSDALNQVVEDGSRFLIIDLSQIDYITHVGLGVLVKCLTRLNRQRGDLRLVGPNQRIADALSLSHLDSLFKGRVVASCGQALHELRRHV